MTIQKLTLEQAIVLTGYTGITHCNFSDFHADVEKRLGHPVFTHEFIGMTEKLQEVYKKDFMAMMPEGVKTQ